MRELGRHEPLRRGKAEGDRDHEILPGFKKANHR
jgi:hypothetical protein